MVHHVRAQALPIVGRVHIDVAVSCIQVQRCRAVEVVVSVIHGPCMVMLMLCLVRLVRLVCMVSWVIRYQVRLCMGLNLP